MSAFDEIERVARLSHGRLVAILASRTGNVTAAMDALSDAVLRALELWPLRGVPANPEAWLVATARNRAADAGRTAARAAAATETLTLLEEERTDMGQAATPDRILNLMFVCAHPAIQPRSRTPLMLQLVLGLDARRMAGPSRSRSLPGPTDRQGRHRHAVSRPCGAASDHRGAYRPCCGPC